MARQSIQAIAKCKRPSQRSVSVRNYTSGTISAPANWQVTQRATAESTRKDKDTISTGSRHHMDEQYKLNLENLISKRQHKRSSRRLPKSKHKHATSYTRTINLDSTVQNNICLASMPTSASTTQHPPTSPPPPRKGFSQVHKEPSKCPSPTRVTSASWIIRDLVLSLQLHKVELFCSTNRCPSQPYPKT